MNQVSGQSAYTGELVNSVEQVIELVKPLVEQKKYLRNLFDKTCRSVVFLLLLLYDILLVPPSDTFRVSLLLAKFTNALVKSRPLGEIGAEQVRTY